MRSITRFAPIIFVLLWSTGFVGAKFILPYAPPFVFLTIRYAFATAFLILIAGIIHEPLKINRIQVIQSLKTGFFLQFIYIGGVFYAVHLGVSAGVTAVIVSTQPILVSILAVRFLNEALGARKVVGLVLGFIGVMLLLLPKSLSGDFSLQFSRSGIVASVVALLGTTAGYLLQKKGGSDIPFLPGTAVQFAVAMALFGVAGFGFEDWKVHITFQFILALAWIVIALSIGSIFLLFYLLKHDSASSVSSLYYLVPPLTAIQAYLFFGEVIKPMGLLGMCLAAIGTVLVTKK